MKAWEFQTQLQPDCSLAVPREFAEQIPTDQPLWVIIIVPEATEDRSWKRLTQEQFLSGYSESDSVYDSV